MANPTSDRLRSIKTFETVPEEQLQWLIDASEVRHLDVGESLFAPDMTPDYMCVILEGIFTVYGNESGSRKFWNNLKPDEITGVLPYSRLKRAMATAEAIEPAVVMCLHRDKMPEMIRTQYELTESLVHRMMDRTRDFSQLQMQQEKLAALGKLSAGLAHELNNPASAMVRSAQSLQSHLKAVPEKFKSVIQVELSSEQVDVINDLLFSKIESHDQLEELSLIERTEREDALVDWLDDHEVENSMDIAETLLEFGFGEEDLDFIYEHCGDTDTPRVVEWVGTILTTEKMVDEIHAASQRIAELIKSVKAYSYMDRDQDLQPVDIHEGIKNTLTMLNHKLQKAGHEVITNWDTSLPKIKGLPGELNQVWTNLIDNAIDAMDGQKGKLEITTRLAKEFVCVYVTDNGPGIPEDVRTRIFEPFFTTKEMGKGTGLGLDIVGKIIKQHEGSIRVRSEPGNTCFEVCFPIAVTT